MKNVFLWLSIAVCCASAETVLQLDPAQTTTEFTLHDVLHTVHGTFKLKRGAIQLDPSTGRASGEIVIDVASGDSGSAARDRRMHKDILESAKYPEAVFVPDRIDGALAPEGTSQVDAHGLFKIHGAEHELTMHLEVQANAGQYTASAHFTIPYVKWGMKNPSNFLLKVDDHVEMTVRTVAKTR